jgi:hypothetical protein
LPIGYDAPASSSDVQIGSYGALELPLVLIAVVGMKTFEVCKNNFSIKAMAV